MLSNQEKQEMIADSKNKQRQNDFAKPPVIKPSLDDYIKFLMSTQKILGSFPVNRQPTITTHNKL
ncbi:hypothetical protein A2291_06145 [candidate division WOR-1 bacterium RIFOXYB2_FULL_42_35]|uniref:Uncharacterized protein n=1 Tax=candidate division WOR-1 bacterium RIFOXYC2_FULL_41_25 TaxID=1802586 RepID=A0A1F4TRA6_UNCSA|nr:MAG: hypothetical protein A2247_04025 [candidate division WOR-1 bacterium RIFOXYA2_FULL_41_14]OGC24968.1 MAG: hypothetical protein A2291_06145 [candidate division WOR-1 bacterium RIFOXYB2_FULL_42_35]OGC35167.1 MAG: hypothetical protein A2462_02100 [candidate division WOR-1 bacterium RIFOXYC2_FULL_41_25]